MNERNYRVAFYTLGCKVNQYETQALREKFIEAGFEAVDDEAECDEAECDGRRIDAYVINTCSVTSVADRKSRQHIRRVKRACPDAVIAVTGCYAQTGEEALKRIEDVDIIAGTNEKGRLVELVTERLAKMNSSSGGRAEQSVCVLQRDEINGFEELGIITGMSGRSRAYIKIEEGCDRFCSYCIIPYARGGVRSRSAEKVLEEAESLINSGVKEIVLTGINTALYGKDLKNGYDIADLTEEISGIYTDNDFRIRLSSLEPNVVDAEMAGRLIGSDRLCHHMHLSLQSGCNSVLRRMNRNYDIEMYRKIVDVLRSADRLYGITTDIIAGFPGETEAEFRESVNNIKAIGFSRIHAFKYSERAGTRAAEMSGHIDGNTKNRRAGELIELASAEEKSFYECNKGSEAEVLVEEAVEYGGVSMVRGYSGNYIRVYIENSGIGLLNKFARVRLTDIYRDGMKGELIY